MLGSGVAEQELSCQTDVDRGDVAICRKREDYLEWSEYFMAVAFLSAQRSKDPNSQVGACIVNPENKIVGIGYNGMPNRCSDDSLPWARTAKNKLDTKYMYGISKVTYMSDKYRDLPEMKASRLMLDMAGVEYSQFTPKNKTITIDFDTINKSGSCLQSSKMASTASP
ncbi:deoxycytidylate deaminase isoform X2 [Pristis pectinata]|uniref:deoxycytidylate deaminase isoform X2 n=1 Tax=Pristis pectinata TaxID=685728 RepID=UPI00223D64CB|nr:deoxycytidylate deaminase isoform X2 [Pristis pectinata]